MLQSTVVFTSDGKLNRKHVKFDQMKYEDFIHEFSLLEIGDQKSLDAKTRTEKNV